MNWYLGPLKKYAEFNGRARRKEYWLFVLINGIIINILSTMAMGNVFTSIMNGNFNFSFGIFNVILSLYSLATLIPGLALIVRRLHDIGKSGGWFFITLIPLIGGIWFLVLMCTDSTPGPNQYGPNPKE